MKPFKVSTFKNAHWFCTHMVNSIGSKLYYPSNTFKWLRGSIDSPLRSIQTRFCISCTTIWKDPNMVLYQLYYHLERTKQGFVSAVPTIWKEPNKVLYQLYYHLERIKQGFVSAVILPFGKTATANGFVSNGALPTWYEPNKVLYQLTRLFWSKFQTRSCLHRLDLPFRKPGWVVCINFLCIWLIAVHHSKLHT